MTVHCAKCNHQWEVEMELPMEISKATAIMSRTVHAGCPQCGATGASVMCGPALSSEGRPTDLGDALVNCQHSPRCLTAAQHQGREGA
jgi:hypothetical protein